MKEEIFLKLEKKIGNEVNCLRDLEPREGLASEIMSVIYKKMLIKARVKLALTSSAAMLLLGYSVLNREAFISLLVNSETGQLLTMFFSNTELILANWKIFALYFLETFPYVPVMAGLTFVLLILGIIRFIVEQMSVRNHLTSRKYITLKY